MGEDIFSHYAYFSSYSDSWVAHAKQYVQSAAARLGLAEDSFVVEVASNDGYLLQHVRDLGIRCLGVEPAANIAEVARAKGIDTVCEFLGQATGTAIAAEHGKADLVVANNVFAHVPSIVDFARGLRALLKDDGTVTIEIPHLLRLIEDRLYDTIYHEHYSYLSLLTTQRVLAEAGLTVVDVEELPTHGGSLRTWSMPVGHATEPSERVAKVLSDERAAGLDTVEGHAGFAEVVSEVRDDLVEFLIAARRQGSTVAGYGAPGKGNTLLNHAGVREDLLDLHRGPQHVQAGDVPARHPHPHPRPGEAGRDQAGLHPDPPVEPPRGDHCPARVHPGVGSEARRAARRSSRSSEGTADRVGAPGTRRSRTWLRSGPSPGCRRPRQVVKIAYSSSSSGTPAS